MSDTIDYDELDKAVSAAIKSTGQSAKAVSLPHKTRAQSPVVKNTSVHPRATRPVVKNTTAQASVVKNTTSRPRRSQYMDMVRPGSKTRQTRPLAATSSQSPASTAPKTITRPTPRVGKRITTTETTITQTTSTHAVRPMRQAAKNTISPEMASKIRQQQLLQKKRQLVEQQRRAAQLKKQQLLAQRAKAINDANRLDTSMSIGAAAAAHRAKTGSSNPQNTSLARSAAAAKQALERHDAPTAKTAAAETKSNPRDAFINTSVAKRPLGDNSGASRLKNIYAPKNAKKADKTTKRDHDSALVVDTDDKASGWIWTLVVLLIISAGAGLGYLVYLLVFSSTR